MDKFEDNVTPTQLTEEYREVVGIVPALHKYQKEHSAINLQKLCVEVADFCNAIYASTQSEAERSIYHDMLKKIIKK